MDLHARSVVATYVTLGLLDPETTVPLVRSSGAPWHPAEVVWHPTSDCRCSPVDAGVTEGVRVADLLHRTRDHHNAPAAWSLCPEMASGDLGAGLPVGDRAAVGWISVAHRVLARTGEDTADATDLLEILAVYDVDYAWDLPGTAEATHPVVLDAAGTARADLLAQLTRHGDPGTPEGRSRLLRRYAPLLQVLATDAPEHDLVTLAGPTMVALAGEIAARSPRLPADLAAQAWWAFTAVKVWRGGLDSWTGVDHAVVFDHHAGTGLTLTPAVGDHRTATADLVVCVDDGYTADEVAAAWRTLSADMDVARPGVPVAARSARVADFIAAHRAALA